MFEKLKGKLSDKDLDSVRSLFVLELKNLLDAEQQILDAMPDMIEEAGYVGLKDALEGHREETQDHVERLKEILKSMDEDAEGEKCEAMGCLINEAKTRMGMEGFILAKDAALASTARKIEHYEIVSYTIAIDYAELLGDLEAYNKLSRTLSEEKDADEMLNDISLEETGNTPVE